MPNSDSPGEEGGFLMEIDSRMDEKNTFRSQIYQMPYNFKDPDDDLSEIQFAYMRDYINEIEASLYDDKRFANREYSDYMDIASFIDFPANVNFRITA